MAAEPVTLSETLIPSGVEPGVAPDGPPGGSSGEPAADNHWG